MNRVLLPTFFIACALSLSATPAPRIGILPITGTQISEGVLSYVTDTLRHYVATSDAYSVIDERTMEEVFTTEGTSIASCSQKTCAKRAGEMLHADAMLFGYIVAIEGAYLLQVQMLSVHEGIVTARAKETFTSMDGIALAIENAAETLTGARIISLANPDEQEYTKKWSRMKIATFIGGVSSLSLGVGLNILGFSTLESANTFYSDTYMITSGVTAETVSNRYYEYAKMIDMGNTENIIAYSLYGIGIGLITAWFFLPYDIHYAYVPTIRPLIAVGREGAFIEGVAFAFKHTW